MRSSVRCGGSRRFSSRRPCAPTPSPSADPDVGSAGMGGAGDLHVTQWGDDGGERVVLVHGSMAAGAETWHDQRSLAGAKHVVVPDRRSYGDSPDGDGDFERDATDVADLLGSGGHLVGHSYGGVVSLLAAA